MSDSPTDLQKITSEPISSLLQNLIWFMHERARYNFLLTIAISLAVMYFLWNCFQSRNTQLKKSNSVQDRALKNKQEAKQSNKKILIRKMWFWGIVCGYFALTVWVYWENDHNHIQFSDQLLWFGLLIPLYLVISEQTTLGIALIYCSFLFVCYFFKSLVCFLLLALQIIFCIMKEGQIQEKEQERATIQTTQSDVPIVKDKQQKKRQNKQLYFIFSACLLLGIIFDLLQFFQPVTLHKPVIPYLIVYLKPLIALGYLFLENKYIYNRYYLNYYHLAEQEQHSIWIINRKQIKLFHLLNFLMEILLLLVFHLRIGYSLFQKDFQIILLIQLPFLLNFFALVIWQKTKQRKLMLNKKYKFHMKNMWILRILMLTIFIFNGQTTLTILSVCCTLGFYVNEISKLFQFKYVAITWQKKTLYILCIYLIYVNWKFIFLPLIGLIFFGLQPQFRLDLNVKTRKLFHHLKIKWLIQIFLFLIMLIFSFWLINKFLGMFQNQEISSFTKNLKGLQISEDQTTHLFSNTLKQTQLITSTKEKNSKQEEQNDFQNLNEGKLVEQEESVRELQFK